MSRKRIKFGWFNAWVGFCWLILFIPCFLFSVHYESYLGLAFTKTTISKTEIVFSRDSSIMKIMTDKGEFIYQMNEYFDTITTALENSPTSTIWYDDKDRRIADLYVNSHFVIPKYRALVVAYFIGLIVSTFFLVVSILSIFKTKGWGDYDLLEKHPEGLFTYIKNSSV